MKKVLCLLMAICIVGGMLAACGNEGKTETTPGSAEDATGATTNNQDMPSVDTDTPIVDLKVCEPDLEIALSLDGNDVIYDGNGIKITMTSVEKQGWEYSCNFEVVNNSDKIIQLCGNYVKVNNQSTSLYTSEIVPAGETRQEKMNYDAADFVEEPMEYLELAFSIMECASEDYQDYAGPLVEDVLAVYQAEGYDGKKYSPTPNGELAYEDSYVAVYFDKNYTPTGNIDMFGYTVINKTEIPMYFEIASCEYTLNRHAEESVADCIGSANVLAPNSYLSGSFRVDNWRDDIEARDLTSGVFTLEGYLIDCSDEMDDAKFYDILNNKEDVRQTLPFHGKTFTISFPENEKNG